MRQQGFTLIEVMVAMAIMAVMGTMAWVGMDVLIRSQQHVKEQGVRTAQTQIALQQWMLDLDQAWKPDALSPMGWDGKVFRLTRRAAQPEAGVTVVAWTVRDNGQGKHLMRWQSAPFTGVEQWQKAWEHAANWARSVGGGEGVALLLASEMEIFVWSGNAWVNGQTSASSRRRRWGGGGSNVQQPQAVRMQLGVPQGVLTKDWVALTFSEPKS